MKKKEKRMILVLIAILIVVIVIFVTTRDRKDSPTNTAKGNSSISQTQAAENYEVLENGTKLNNSKKLNSTKTFDDIKVTDIQLKEKDNVTEILATITNTSSSDKDGYLADISLLDKEGNEIGKISDIYIQPLKAKESAQLSANGIFGNEYVNAYDLTITKK